MAHAASGLYQRTSIVESFRNRIALFKAARARHAEYDRKFAALQKISASELKEFGLYRSDLPELARGSVK